MFRSEESSGDIDDIFPRCRHLLNNSCTQQFARFLFERAVVCRRVLFQASVQCGVNVADQQAGHDRPLHC